MGYAAEMKRDVEDVTAVASVRQILAAEGRAGKYGFNMNVRY